MIPDRMRNPLGVNIHAGIPAWRETTEAVWEPIGTVVADRRTSPSAALVAVFAVPIQGTQTKNSSISFVGKACADKNGRAGFISRGRRLMVSTEDMEKS